VCSALTLGMLSLNKPKGSALNLNTLRFRLEGSALNLRMLRFESEDAQL